MLSIIVTWRDREELGQALPSILKTARALHGDVTIVNFGGSPQALERQLKGREHDVNLVSVRKQPYFNKPCAQNLGASHSGQPFLFFCDCDIILDSQEITGLLHSLIHQPDAFATLANVKETQPAARGSNNIVCIGYDLYIRTANDRELRINHRQEDLNTGIRMAPGLLLIRRSHFLAVQGYNSRFEGWGWESQDIISRLILGEGLTRINQGSAIHISHEEYTRVAHARNPNRWENRDKMFREALANYNSGDFLGTYLSDIQETPSELADGFSRPLKQ